MDLDKAVPPRTSTRLTKSKIELYTYREKTSSAGSAHRRDVRWDSDVPGLGLRIFPSGNKSFVLSYRFHGRKRLMSIGDFGVFILEQAQARARKHLVHIADGRDPLTERERDSLGDTMGQLCDLYLLRHASKKKSGHDDRLRIERTIRPRWGGRKVKSLTRPEVTAFHAAYSVSAPYEANRHVALLRKMFNLAQTWGIVDELAPNPATRIQLNKEVRRDRWIEPDEVPKLFVAIRQEESIYVRAAFHLYLLTGLRKNKAAREWHQTTEVFSPDKCNQLQT